ncbi:MAG: MFS transporter [Bacteroidota bacterium]|jgi:ACS family D-galactonate transporter-like MFS transporter
MTESKKYPWIVVGLLWVVALLNYMDRQMIATMRPSMQLDITELSQATNYGYLMAVFLWVYGSMSSFSGIIADRINRKGLIIGSLFVWSLVTFAMGFAKTFNTLYWLRALMGFSEALYIPAGLSLIADYHSDKTRSLAVGLHMSGIYMGQALGGFGATVAKQFSWQYAFMFFGGFGMVYAVVLLFFLQDNIKREIRTAAQKGITSIIKSVTGLLSSFSFWIIILYFAVPSFPGWAIKNWAPTLIADKLHIDMSIAGPLTTISISLSSLFGVIVGGYFSDKWVQQNIRARVYIGAMGLSLMIPALLLLGYSNSIVIVFAAASMFGFGFGMFDTNNMPILCQFVPSSSRATAYGLLNTAGIFAGAVITDYLGKSTDAGNLNRDFAALAGIVIVVIVLQLLFLKPREATA